MFSVRQADATDIPRLAHHRAAMFRDMGQLAAHLEEPLEQATAAWLREALPRGEYLAWVAEEQGTAGNVIGGAGVQLRRSCRARAPASTIWSSGPKRSCSTSTSSPAAGGAASPKR